MTVNSGFGRAATIDDAVSELLYFPGVLIVVFGIVVLYLQTKQSYKRIAPAEEQVLPLDQSEDGSHNE